MKSEDEQNIDNIRDYITTSLYKTRRYLPVFADRISLKDDESEYSRLRKLDVVTAVYVRSGAIRTVFDECEVDVTSNNGIIVKNGVAYALFPAGEVPADVIIIMYHYAAVYGFGTNMLANKYRNPLSTQSAPDFLQFNCRTEPGIEITRLMDDIYYASSECNYGWELYCKGMLCIMTYHILGLYSPIPVKTSEKRLNNDEYRVRQAMDYVDMHYMDPITLEDMAASIHISKSECCRCFKRVLDLSPIEYVVRYRIYAAAAILDDPMADISSISDLAVTTGHNNVSYFIKMFKRYMGLTPTEFRNESNKRNSWVNGNTSI